MARPMWSFVLVFMLFVDVCSSWRLRPTSHGFFDRLRRRPGLGFDLGFGDSDPWFSVGLNFGGSSRPWWEGPNVCVSREVKPADDSGDISTHTVFQTVVCDGSDTSFRCITNKPTPSGRVVTTETYECCSGYTRKPTDHGCQQAISLEPLLTRLGSLGLDGLASLLMGTGLDEDMSDPDLNFTVFAPTNEALQDLTDLLGSQTGLALKDMGSVVMVSRQISDVLVKDTSNVLLGHVLTKRVTTSHMQDEQLLETASPFKTKIRINTYRKPVNIITANCVKITRPDNMASNGVVHVVEKHLFPVTDSLLDIVSKNPELSALKTVLGRSQLASTLREDGHLTLIAPTDGAFKKHRALLKKLLTDQTCVNNFLKSHILPNVICSSVIQGNARTPNMLTKYTNLTRDADGKLYADGAQIVTPDVMATNGVLHIIDDIIIPDEALDLLELAERQGLSAFFGLVRQAGLEKELLMAENVTLFIPSNEAVETMSALSSDSLGSLLRYHVVPEVHSCSSLYNNRQLYTSQKEARLRFNEYSRFPYRNSWTQTVQCSPVRPERTSGCNGVFYVVDKVLMPPVGNVLDVLSRDPQFSTLIGLLKVANLSDTFQAEGPFTVFAPTNQAFDNLDDDDAIIKLTQDPLKLRNILLNHVASDFVCCAAIMERHWYHTQKIRTDAGTTLLIHRDGPDNVQIDTNNVVTCDLTATNGVVHAIDGLLVKEPEQTRLKSKWDWKDLFY